MSASAVWNPTPSAYSVSDLTYLSGLTLPSPLPEGWLVYVESVDEYYRYAINYPIAPDGVNVISSESVSGVWVKTSIIRLTQSFRSDQVVHTCAVNGQKGFLITRNSWVRANQNDMTVELSTDSGITWRKLQYGTEWSFCVRGYGNWQQPTTEDASVGAWLTDPRSIGDMVRLTWKTGDILCPPPEPLPAKVLDGPPASLDPGPSPMGNGKWAYPYTNPPFPFTAFPNGLVLGNRAGLQIEIWRHTLKSPKVWPAQNLPAYKVQKTGRFWSPYYRLPLAANSGDTFLSPSDLLTLGKGGGVSKVYQFRFAYYDPTTGARTGLSTAQARFVRRANGEGTFGASLHPQFSVWVRS